MPPEQRKAVHDAMVRLADGDRSGMPALVAHLWPVLLDFARRTLRHEQDAEDVAQEVFVRICSRISELDVARDGLSWAFGIATYEILTHRRRAQRRRETFDTSHIETEPTPHASQEEAVIRADLEAALHEVLGQLTLEDRAQLGVTDTSPVAATGATARKRRQRALGRLRILWRSIHGEP